jgi:hypothetical protein
MPHSGFSHHRYCASSTSPPFQHSFDLSAPIWLACPRQSRLHLASPRSSVTLSPCPHDRYAQFNRSKPFPVARLDRASALPFVSSTTKSHSAACLQGREGICTTAGKLADGETSKGYMRVGFNFALSLLSSSFSLHSLAENACLHPPRSPPLPLRRRLSRSTRRSSSQA